MKKIYSLILFLSLIFMNIQVQAKEFLFDQSMNKVYKAAKNKSYQKALNLALKVKKENLTEDQKKEVQDLMEALFARKQFDDAIKKFYVEYDKYENFYVYYPLFIVWNSITPYVYYYSKPIFKIKFQATYYSKARMHPDKIILNFDGVNKEYKPFSSSDNIISYDTYKREVCAWVNFTEDEALYFTSAMRSNDVSFKIKDSSSSLSALGQVSSAEKELIKSAQILYFALKKKVLEPGKNRV